jgi:hypothetical protein
MKLPLDRKNIVLGLVMVMLASSCLLGAYTLFKLDENFRPSPEQVKFTLEQHIRPPNVDSAWSYVSEVQVETVGMGQGVYIRFKTDETFINMMLQGVPAGYPYKSTSCDDFFKTYPSFAEGIKWWKPHKIVSPVCYYTENRQYLLVDPKDSIVYYYSFPDFLGRGCKTSIPSPGLGETTSF